jgi:hypothetical protein
MSRFAIALLPALLGTLLAVAPVGAQTRDGADEQCRAAAAREGVRVLSIGAPREEYDYQDRLKHTDVTIEIVSRGRVAVILCQVYAPSGRVVLNLPDDHTREDEKDRPVIPRPSDVPSLRSTQERCEGAAHRSGYRVQELVRQDDRYARGRVLGRETQVNLRRDGRNWRLVCVFDFRQDRMTTDLYRR